MKEKQQQLTFNKGITNVPSDALCSDNALAESIGMVYDDSEHRVIQKPVDFMTGLTGKTLLYVHEYNDQKRYIVKTTESNNDLIKWGTKNSSDVYEENTTALFTVSGTPTVTSIGKILIISDAAGMHCFLWKSEGGTDLYTSINFPFPDIALDVKLEASESVSVTASGKVGDVLVMGDSHWEIRNGQQDSYNNLVVGLYSKNLKSVASAKGFAKPFAVRAALELYDGSYTFITNPILLFPCVSKNSFGFLYSGRNDDGHWTGSLVVETYFSRLYVRQLTDYSEYHDIVKDVVLFATKGVNMYNTSADQPFEVGEADDFLADAISTEDITLGACQYRTFNNSPTILTFKDILTQRSTDDIKGDLESDAIFYKLCSLGPKSFSGYVGVGTLADETVFENITTQEQLSDDYYSRCKLKTNLMYAYNSRLNLANVSRGVFKGFGFFMPFEWNNSAEHIYEIYTKIKLDTQSVWVANMQIQTSCKQGIYFFYPDPRAEHVTIYRHDFGESAVCVCDADLKESEGLNGAYYLKEYPSSTTDETTVAVGNNGFHLTSWTKDGQTMPADTYNNYATERLPNYIIQSEVNNPFVFKAAGYFKVGTGKILAMSSVTQALSEGQFGQFPLLVFSESGIWALAVASTGYYSSVHPISREVSNDPPCLIQTDGAVFFTSKKGLMVVVGSQVKCVSEQMSGKTNVFKDGSNVSLVTDLGDFVDYLKSAYIAYDYRDSLLWIFNSGYTTCYTYSIKSGTFSKFTPSTKITNVVNCYPDYLLQDSTKVYSLMGRNDINKDGTTSDDVFTPNRYSACIFTRPMKLENALALKSIMQVKHIHDIPNLNGANVSDPTLTLRIFASNNLKNWTELTSLRGIPWKYYRFRFDFANLIATDRFAGTMLITQERRIDKLR